MLDCLLDYVEMELGMAPVTNYNCGALDLNIGAGSRELLDFFAFPPPRTILPSLALGSNY